MRKFNWVMLLVSIGFGDIFGGIYYSGKLAGNCEAYMDCIDILNANLDEAQTKLKELESES